MWLLKWYVLTMLVTSIPLAAHVFLFRHPSGPRVFWTILGVGVLGFIASPFLMAAGYMRSTLSVMGMVVMFYIVWVLLTLLGLVVWAIFFIFVEILLAVLGIKFSLFKFIIDKI